MPELTRPRLPDLVWSPLASGAVMLVIGLIGWAAGLLLLFPSLASTAVIQAHKPNDPTARPYHVVVGHIGGLIAAYIAVAIFGLATAPSVFDLHHLTLARVGAAVVAIVLAMALEGMLHSTHAPAASTTLLAALGSFKLTAHDALTVIAGVVAVAVVGEVVRRARMAQLERQP